MIRGLLFACAAVAAFGGPGPGPVEIVVERQEAKIWHQIDPQLVLSTNDMVRFRFRSIRSGYLYVINRDSGGAVTVLYPRGTGASGRLQSGVWYLVPGGIGYFRVGGQPGWDVTYWLLSPVPFAETELVKPPLAYPNSARPRCNQEWLKSRGMCLDSGAGLSSSELPGAYKTRELRFEPLSQGSGEGEFLFYEFRIAHR
jgi:hypothetical protein